MGAAIDYDKLVDKLILRVLEAPEEGETLAKEYGLWDIVRDRVVTPLRRKLCREDVNYFIEYVVTDPETGGPAKQQSFHKEWQVLIDENKRVLIVAPRGHGKTVQVVARIVWEIGRNHNIRIKVIGSTDEKAKEILGLVKAMIKSSPKVKEIFPDLEIDDEQGDTKGAFFVKRSIQQRDATVEAAGVLSAGAGGRADILICDDVVDMKNAIINPSMREQVCRVVRETWFSLVAATGKIVWIATPYHVLDATYSLKNDSGDLWKVWWTPAIQYHLQFDEHGEPIMVDKIDPETGLVEKDQFGVVKQTQQVIKEYLWPDKWNEQTLADKFIEVGDRVFARQYLLNAMSDDERTFPEDDLKRSYDHNLHDIGVGIEEDWPTFCGIDLASSLRKKAAYTVVVILAKSMIDGRFYIKDIWRRKVGFSRTLEVVEELFSRHHWRFGYVENNGYQRAVEEAVAESFKEIPLAGFHTGVGKADEQIGLPGLSMAFKRGLFALPAAKFPLPEEDTSELAVLMRELSTHPGGDHSDCVMALWFAYRAAIEGQGEYQAAYAACAGMSFEDE